MRPRSSVFAAMLWGAVSHCAPVHTPPAVEQSLPAVNVAVAAPAASSSPSQAPAAPIAEPPSRTVYGFLGARGIVGTLGAAEGQWSGAFRFLGTEGEIPVKGRAWLNDDEGSPPEEPVLDGRKVHTFFDCEFSTGGALPGAVSEASCLDEPGLLEIDGEWSSGKRAEPFYVRTPASMAIDASEYYAALMATPTPSHACPPFVDLLQSAVQSTGRTTLLYLLTWPCDRQADAEVSMFTPGRTAQPPPPTHEAYLAEVASSAPEVLRWSSSVSVLPDPDESNEVSVGLAFLDLAPDLELYIASVSDHFQSPVTSAGNEGETREIWAVSTQGQYGPKLSLTVGQAGHAGWCFSFTASSEVWLMDLDADKLPELVVRTTTTGRRDAVVNGQVACVDTPAKRVLRVYRLHAQTLAWKPVKPAPRVSEARLASARPLNF